MAATRSWAGWRPSVAEPNMTVLLQKETPGRLNGVTQPSWMGGAAPGWRGRVGCVTLFVPPADSAEHASVMRKDDARHTTRQSLTEVARTSCLTVAVERGSGVQQGWISETEGFGLAGMGIRGGITALE